MTSSGPPPAYWFQGDQHGQQQPLYSPSGPRGSLSAHYNYNGVPASVSFGQQQPQFPSGTPTQFSSDFSVDKLQEFLRPTHDSPWVPSVPQQFGNHGSFELPDHIGKAATVAEPPTLGSCQRPTFQGKPSYTSAVDSGFFETQTHAETEEGVPPALYATNLLERPSAPETIHSAPDGRKRRRATKSQETSCRLCPKILKNHSEVVKHRQQHEKPFVCQEPNCTREGGFGTQNDLERHRKSVHRQTPAVGDKDGYLCSECSPPADGSPRKWWPRLDNFKAHITRKHKGIPVQTVVTASKYFRRPDSAVGSSEFTQADGQDLSSPLALDMSRHGSYQGAFNCNGAEHRQAESLAGIGGAGQMPSDVSHADNEPGMYARIGGSTLGNIMEPLIIPRIHCQDSQTAPMHTLPYEGQVTQSGFLHPDVSSNSLENTIINQQYVSPKRHCVATSLDKEHYGTAQRDHIHLCTYCGKVKKRECDLRKHRKRHTRPYGCTFPNCDKRLGSRNDWKRHENSQHELLDMWLCDSCRWVTRDKETFYLHLERAHGIPMNTQVSHFQCTQHHLGREGHYHFWCGFCVRIISQQPDNGLHPGIEPGTNAWEERSKHIGNHFDKDQFTIDTWVHIEPHNPPQHCVVGKSRRKGKNTRSLKRTITDVDDSDLGEDGIPANSVNFGNHNAGLGSSYPNMEFPSNTLATQQGIMNNQDMIYNDNIEDADGVSDEEC